MPVLILSLIHLISVLYRGYLQQDEDISDTDQGKDQTGNEEEINDELTDENQRSCRVMLYLLVVQYADDPHVP